MHHRPLRIVSIGGGPAGLYFGIQMKLRDPRHDVLIFERNRPGDTFGWGVVFSATTLGTLEAADPVSYRAITESMAWWDDIDVYYRGGHLRSTGHGFCGLSRVKLLALLRARAAELGCRIVDEREVSPDELAGPPFSEADLILAADGVNSALRTQFADTFQPSFDWRKCKFAWLGSTLRWDAFTFLFRENEHGLFQVHGYPFDDKTSTFIVECREEVWRAAGLDQADEDATIAYMEMLFAEDLKGHHLLRNRTIWRTFPTIRNASWVHGNMVLMGDACHTAHYSIGSGTKLAMEDAIALAQAFDQRPDAAVTDVLAHYEAARRPEVERLQTAAQTSLEWFENDARYLHLPAETFTFSLMTRSKRITWSELQKRDPVLVDRVHRHWHGVQTPPDRPLAPPLFTPLQLRSVTLPNRVVVSPMCQYSAVDGMPSDWHLVHLGSRAVGGAGLVMTEATAMTPDGRITPGCTGIWNDAQVEGWSRVTRFVHEHSRAKIGLQLAHAGRKAACHRPWEEGGKPLTGAEAWPLVAPSAIAWDEASQVPHALDEGEIATMVSLYEERAERALAAGFDLLELHFAHGYLMSTFLSALTNRREDRYGGSLENRLRFPIEAIRATRRAWPAHLPLSVRISATEWAEGGLSDADRVRIARAFVENGADILDVSAGGVVPWQKPVYGRMFQVPFSDQIRNEANVRTMTVGNIQDGDQGNTILAAGRADLVVLARGHLADPYFTLHAAAEQGWDEQPWPVQYLAAKPRRRKG